MYVVVAGAGRMGAEIARALRQEGHDIAVIDPDPRVLRAVGKLDVSTVEGNAASLAVQAQARVENADVFFALADHDEVNLLACALAKVKGCRTVARVNSLDYMGEPISTAFSPIGVDHAICPDLVSAIRVARVLDMPSMLDMEILARGKVQVIESRVAKGARAAGRRVKDLGIPAGVNLVSILRDREILVPGGKDELMEGDRLLLVAADASSLARLEPSLGSPAVAESVTVDRVMVVGATRIGLHLARVLDDKRKEVIVIDADEGRCQKAIDTLPGVLVVHGNATDREVLVEESIESVDAVVGAADAEEYNLLTCVLAKQLGVRRTVAFLSQPDLQPLAERIGIDLSVNPNLSSVNTFLKFAHEREPFKVAILQDGQAEILEFDVRPGSDLVGRKLRAGDLPKGAVVGAIVRGGQVVVPRGNDYFAAGDHVVVFAKAGAVQPLSKLL